MDITDVIVILDNRLSIITDKTNSFKKDYTQINRLVKNYYSNELELFYSTSDIEQIEVYIKNECEFYIYSRNNNKEYMSIGKLSNICILKKEKGRIYIHGIISNVYNKIVKHRTNDYKMDIFKELGYNIKNSDLKYDIFCLGDLELSVEH